MQLRVIHGAIKLKNSPTPEIGRFPFETLKKGKNGEGETVG